MTRNLSYVALVAAVSFAGCLDEIGTVDAAGPVSPSADVYGPIAELLQGVPCEVDAVDAKTSANLKPLGQTRWDEGYGTYEVDIRNNLVLAARTPGFAIIDIADPLAPVVLSNYAEGSHNLDIKFSPDNATAILGKMSGVELVDIRDPTEPVLVGEWHFSDVPKFPAGPSGLPNENGHMLFSARIAEEDWVFIAPNSQSGTWILRLEGPPEDRSLRFVTTTKPLVQGGPMGPHDMVAQFDETLKKWVLYESDGFQGWAAWDITAPAKPALIGGYQLPHAGYVHTIQASMVGSRRLVATVEEVGSNMLRVYDATDLSQPSLIGSWKVPTGGARTDPQHNFNIVAGTLYMAHYGHGFFIFDLTKLGTTFSPTALRPMAHYADQYMGATTTQPVGGFWDVLLRDGILYASSFGDSTDGLHVVGFGCNTPGDPALSSIN